ncbi:MAG: class I SAM-dependent methyltransferase [Candidatus Aminicenantes bacterium]|nr:class I SAM-dependent methyltransferase [Candidatus Aminicenantes bacterium]
MTEARAGCRWAGGDTFLISLHCRILDNLRSNPVVRDEKAVSIGRAVGYDFEQLSIPRVTVIATSLRVKKFDREARSFLGRHPAGTVVNIGCGLETRSFRLDNGLADWIDLDLPEVIEERRKHFPETDRHLSLGISAIDIEWMESIRQRDPEKVLFLGEGVFMFFPERQAKTLVLALQERFRGSELIFDTCSPWVAARSRRRPFLKTKESGFLWGLKNGRDIERWNDGLRLIEEWFYFDQADRDLGWYQALSYIPAVRGMFRILRLAL